LALDAQTQYLHPVSKRQKAFGATESHLSTTLCREKWFRGKQRWRFFGQSGDRFLYPETQRFYNLKDKGKEGDCNTDILTDCGVDFIERKKEEPFFVHLSYYTVHGPITRKAEYIEKYEKRLADNPHADYDMKDPKKAAMIQSLGRVVAKLKEIGQLDNTLIVFTCDNGNHGDKFVVNYRGNKGTAYEGGRFFNVINGTRTTKRKNPKCPSAIPGTGRASVPRAILADEH
jgi:hypothetical protein